MARSMPNLAQQFEQRATLALALAEAGETIFNTSPRSSIAKKQLTLWRLEALYELAFLRIFLEWETFLQESFIRYLCGYTCSTGLPTLINAPVRTLNDARTLILGGRDYISWVHITSAVNRSRRFFNNWLHEQILLSNQARLEWFSFVRHRVAHRSEYSRRMFDNATMSISGRRYRGSSAGRFLRDFGTSLMPPRRQIHLIGEELIDLAKQIVP